MAKLTYQTEGTCSRFIELEVTDGKVTDVCFAGGCHGNLQGIARLVKGMTPDEVIARLKGIRCGSKPTSCPDQLCRALEQMQAKG